MNGLLGFVRELDWVPMQKLLTLWLRTSVQLRVIRGLLADTD